MFLRRSVFPPVRLSIAVGKKYMDLNVKPGLINSQAVDMIGKYWKDSGLATDFDFGEGDPPDPIRFGLIRAPFNLPWSRRGGFPPCVVRYHPTCEIRSDSSAAGTQVDGIPIMAIHSYPWAEPLEKSCVMNVWLERGSPGTPSFMGHHHVPKIEYENSIPSILHITVQEMARP